MTDNPDLERFNAWCRETATDIRNRAAAFGETAEYVYLKRQYILVLTMREKFPTLPELMFDCVEHDCYDPDIPLDLVEINKHRAKLDFPALGFIPTLRLKEEHRAPMPGDVPECPPPPGPSFHEWAVKKLIGIRHSAVAKGRDVVQEFLELQPMYINDIQRNFPEMGAPMGLTFMRMWVTSKEVMEAPLDETQIRASRAWHGALTDVAKDVETLARGEESAPRGPLKS